MLENWCLDDYETDILDGIDHAAGRLFEGWTTRQGIKYTILVTTVLFGLLTPSSGTGSPPRRPNIESCGSNSSHASCSAGLATALAVEDDDDVSSGAGSSSSSGKGDDLKEAHRPVIRYSQDKLGAKKVSAPKEMSNHVFCPRNKNILPHFSESAEH